VIASSGTAFTAAQAALLGRFTKQLVVNFDPDAAGAKATERTLGLLVEEEFGIRVLTLEPGFDPDLFVRRKGKEAYAAALKSSERYFDYLIERARAQFPVRTAEGKAKAVNYLLPHIQRVPSRIVRDEVALEIAQKLSIDSAVLRQDLKQAAVTRKTSAVETRGESQVREAEKILICALASTADLDRRSAHLGRDDASALRSEVRDVLLAERLHAGLGTESLFDTLLNSTLAETDLIEIAFEEEERRLLSSILMKEEELTAEKVQGALRALRRVQIRRKLEQIQTQIESARNLDPETVHALMDQKLQLKRSLMDPQLGREPADDTPGQ
jgi:DNA primase